jgi:hypothetical protein
MMNAVMLNHYTEWLNGTMLSVVMVCDIMLRVESRYSK